MLRVFVILLAFVVPALGSAAQAQECVCAKRSNADAYDAARSVFYGVVVSTEDDVATFKVLSAFKRSKRKRKLKIYQPDSACDVDFEVDQTYLVFASKVKKKLVADHCASTKLAYAPLNPVTWSLSDDASYGLTKKQRRTIEAIRNKLSDTATSKLKDALRRCDKTIWKSKKNVKGLIEVRFDHVEKRLFTATILKYERSAGPDEDVNACILNRLTNVKFPKFGGGPISIRAYRLRDQIDPVMVRKRSNASVVAFKKTSS